MEPCTGPYGVIHVPTSRQGSTPCIHRLTWSVSPSRGPMSLQLRQGDVCQAHIFREWVTWGLELGSSDLRLCPKPQGSGVSGSCACWAVREPGPGCMAGTTRPAISQASLLREACRPGASSLRDSEASVLAPGSTVLASDHRTAFIEPEFEIGVCISHPVREPPGYR